MKLANELDKSRTPNITLNYKDCGSKDLDQAVKKLAAFTGWKDSKDIMRFAKFKNQLQCHQKRAGHWYEKLLLKHCHLEPMKGKDGKPVVEGGVVKMKPKWAPTPQGPMDFDFRDRAAFEKDYRVMGGFEFVIKVYKWTSEELLAAGLNADELIACAKLLEDADDEILEDLESIDKEDFKCPVEMDLTQPETPGGEPFIQP